MLLVFDLQGIYIMCTVRTCQDACKNKNEICKGKKIIFMLNFTHLVPDQWPHPILQNCRLQLCRQCHGLAKVPPPTTRQRLRAWKTASRNGRTGVAHEVKQGVVCFLK